MADMQTLTINGVRYEIKDRNAVRVAEQELTAEQKQQARKNIGAAAEGEGGGFSLVNAENVVMPDGSRLPDNLPVLKTQAEYDALVEAGKINENTPYFISGGIVE